MKAMRKPLVWLCLPMVIFCFALRMLHPGDIPFFADIPHFQTLLDEYQSAGTFPLICFRGSSTYVAYGAGALWIYTLIRLFVSSMEGIAAVYMLLFSLSAFAFFWLLRGKAERGLQWLVVWLCLSAPHLFYSSRTIWDIGFFLPMSAGLLACLDYLDRKDAKAWWAWVLIGLLASFMANTHLSAAPFLFAAGITACWLIWRSDASWRQKALLPGLALAIFVATFLPYVLEAYRLYRLEAVATRSATKPGLWGDGRNLWWLLQRTLMYPGTYGMKVMFGGNFPDFLKQQGTLGGLFRRDFLGWVPKLLALGMIFRLAWEGVMRKRRLSGLELVTVTTFFSVILLLNLVNIPTEAHYFHASWWLPFLALGLGLARLKGRVRTAVVALVVLCAGVNTLFSLGFYQYIREYRGTRVGWFGPVYSEYKAVAEGICSATTEKDIPLDLGGVNGINIYSFDFFLNRLEECHGKSFLFTPDPGRPRFQVQYGGPSPSARLKWELVKP